MKKIGEYTVRGQVLDRTAKRIILFDGRFDTGYRITKFVVIPDAILDVNAYVTGMLATEETALSFDSWDLGDQRQIAWAANKASFSIQNTTTVDPDNFIVEDLFIMGKSGVAASPINYMITMEKYEATDWQGALAMVRNSGQDV